MLRTRNVQCKVYVEGIPVQFNRIEIREQLGAPTNLTLSCPANDRAIFLLPKTVCQVFYGHVIEKEKDVPEIKYYLIFEGQLSGYGINRDARSREMRFTFTGLLTNWATTLVGNMSLGYLSGLTRSALMINGAATNLNFWDDQLNTNDSKGELTKMGAALNSFSAAVVKFENTARTVFSDDAFKNKLYIDILSAPPTNPKTPAEVAATQLADLASTCVAKKGLVASEYAALKPGQKTLIGLKEKVDAAEAWAVGPCTETIKTRLFRTKNYSETVSGGMPGASLLNKIAALLSKEDTKFSSLEFAITHILEESQKVLGAYYKYIEETFKITKRLNVIGSKKIDNLIKTASVFQFFAGSMAEKDEFRAPSLLELFLELVNNFGYTIYELAAPSKTKENPGGIFIAPPGDYLTPIMCNCVFDDEIQSFSFSRDIDREPTRAISLARPFTTAGFSDQSNISRVLMASIVPVTENTISQEELMRGINLLYTEDSIISSIYLYEYLKGKDFTPDKKGGTVNAPADKVKEVQDMDGKTVLEDITAKTKHIADYQTKMATANFYLQRAAARQMTVVTTYSPYRICGLPGVIFDNELPYILGTLSAVSTTISADGNNTQVLTYTNVRFQARKVDSNDIQDNFTVKSVDPAVTTWPGDVSDKGKDITNFIPAWYYDFSPESIHESYYAKLFGEKKKDVIGYAKVLNSKISKLGEALDEIQKAYNNATGLEDISAASREIETMTSRPLYSEEDYFTWANLTAADDTNKDKAFWGEDMKDISAGKTDVKQARMYKKKRKELVRMFFYNVTADKVDKAIEGERP